MAFCTKSSVADGDDTAVAALGIGRISPGPTVATGDGEVIDKTSGEQPDTSNKAVSTANQRLRTRQV